MTDEDRDRLLTILERFRTKPLKCDCGNEAEYIAIVAPQCEKCGFMVECTVDCMVHRDPAAVAAHLARHRR